MLFFAGSAVLAAGLLIATPPFAGFDEPFHWLRAAEIASGRLLPRPLGANDWGDTIGGRDAALLDALVPEMMRGATMGRAHAHAIAKNLAQRDLPAVERSFPTTAAFPPLPYLPASLGIGAAEALSRNPLTAYMAGRSVQGLVYFAMVAVALAAFPPGAALLAAVLLGPSALHLATTLSADPLCNASAALFVAAMLRLRTDPRIRPGVRDMAAAVALGGLKMTYATLLGAVLLPAGRIADRRRASALVLACVSAAAIALLWNTHFVFLPGLYWRSGAEPAASLHALAAQPVHTLGVMARTIASRPFGWWSDADVRFGGGPGPYHFWASPLLAAADLALLILLTATRRARRDPGAALVCALLAALYLFGTLLAFFVAYTPPASPEVLGVQGRYFVPSILLVLFALSFAWPDRVRLPARAECALLLLLLAAHAGAIGVALAHFRRLYG